MRAMRSTALGGQIKEAPNTPVVDPVVQALTLTDVVVQATVSAVLLALAGRAASRFGTADPDRLGALRG